MAHIRQSRPDSGLELQAKVHKSFQVVPLLFRSREKKRNLKDLMDLYLRVKVLTVSYVPHSLAHIPERGDNLRDFIDFYLKVQARIWS